MIYLRHTRTDWEQNDRELAWVPEMLEDRSLLAACDRQRLLNEQGRAEAQAIGERIRNQGIPVARVMVSPWCRTRETGELAFSSVQVSAADLFDTGYLAAGSAERSRYRDRLRALLARRPDGGSNTVIVGHMPQLLDVTGIALEEGHAGIFAPHGGDRFDLIRIVSPTDWDRLDQQ